MSAAVVELDRPRRKPAPRPRPLTYTVAEVAGLLGVSERHLRNQISRQEFPVRPLAGLGRRTVLPRAEVDRYLRGETT